MFIWAAVDLTFIFVFPFLWLAIYGERESIAGFNKQEIVTYYIILAFLNAIVRFYLDFLFIQSIREGEIVQFLIKPINFFLYKYLELMPYQITKLFFFVLFVFIGYKWIGPYLVFPNSFSHAMTIVVVLALCNVLRAILEFIIGISAFWFEEAGGIQTFNLALISVFGGELAPLAFFPLWFQKFASFLPFKYFVAFPCELYLGKLNTDEIISGIGIILIWILIFAGAAIYIWKKGLKHYSPPGDGVRL